MSTLKNIIERIAEINDPEIETDAKVISNDGLVGPLVKMTTELGDMFSSWTITLDNSNRKELAFKSNKDSESVESLLKGVSVFSLAARYPYAAKELNKLRSDTIRFTAIKIQDCLLDNHFILGRNAKYYPSTKRIVTNASEIWMPQTDFEGVILENFILQPELPRVVFIKQT